MNHGDKALYKTVIVVWSDEDPDEKSLTAISLDADTGRAFLASRDSVLVEDPEQDKDWKDTNSFKKVAAAGGGESPPLVGRSTRVPYLRVIK